MIISHRKLKEKLILFPQYASEDSNMVFGVLVYRIQPYKNTGSVYGIPNRYFSLTLQINIFA